MLARCLLVLFVAFVAVIEAKTLSPAAGAKHGKHVKGGSGKEAVSGVSVPGVSSSNSSLGVNGSLSESALEKLVSSNGTLVLNVTGSEVPLSFVEVAEGLSTVSISGPWVGAGGANRSKGENDVILVRGSLAGVLSNTTLSDSVAGNHSVVSDAQPSRVERSADEEAPVTDAPHITAGFNVTELFRSMNMTYLANVTALNMSAVLDNMMDRLNASGRFNVSALPWPLPVGNSTSEAAKYLRSFFNVPGLTEAFREFGSGFMRGVNSTPAGSAFIMGFNNSFNSGYEQGYYFVGNVTSWVGRVRNTAMNMASNSTFLNGTRIYNTLSSVPEAVQGIRLPLISHLQNLSVTPIMQALNVTPLLHAFSSNPIIKALNSTPIARAVNSDLIPRAANILRAGQRILSRNRRSSYYGHVFGPRAPSPVVATTPCPSGKSTPIPHVADSKHSYVTSTPAPSSTTVTSAPTTVTVAPYLHEVASNGWSLSAQEDGPDSYLVMYTAGYGQTTPGYGSVPVYGQAPPADSTPVASYGDAPVYTAPAASYGDAQAYTAPAASYGDAQAYTAPAASYGDAQAYIAPAASYGDAQAYTAPAASYADSPAYDAPAPSYNDAPAYDVPAASYGDAQAYTAPAASYGDAQAYTAPAASYADSPAYDAPAPSYGDAPAYDAPAASYGDAPAHTAPVASYGDSAPVVNAGGYAAVEFDTPLSGIMPFHTQGAYRLPNYTPDYGFTLALPAAYNTPAPYGIPRYTPAPYGA